MENSSDLRATALAGLLFLTDMMMKLDLDPSDVGEVLAEMCKLHKEALRATDNMTN